MGIITVVIFEHSWNAVVGIVVIVGAVRVTLVSPVQFINALVPIDVTVFDEKSVSDVHPLNVEVPIVVKAGNVVVVRPVHA